MDVAACRVLIVDDNEMNRDMLSRRLRKLNFKVGLAQDGLEALKLFKTGLFDVMLLDIMMPGMDGVQVLESIQGDQGYPVVPIIMLTAVKDKAQVVQCLKLGASNYVVKPFDVNTLKLRICEALEQAG